MDVAVIGTGHVGGTLGRALHRAGHAVTFGSSSRPRGELDGVEVRDVATALTAGVVLLAIPAARVEGFVAAHGPALEHTLVVDATNDVGGSGPANARSRLTVVPTLRYARAFNTLGWENFEQPRFGAERADLFFSCDDAGDVATVAALIEGVGLGPVHVGLGAHDQVDALLGLWFALAKERGRHLALRLLTDAG